MDFAAQMTDEEIERFERKLKKEYEKAQREIEKECKRYLKKYEKKDKLMQKKVEMNQLSRDDYITWRMNQLAQGKRYQDLMRSIENQLVQTNVVAAQMVNDATPRVYTENINYAMYDVEKGIKAQTSFSLYNTTTVRNSIMKGDMYIPKASVDIPKDRLWNRKKVQSVFTQSVIKGESIPEISRSLRQVTDANIAQATRTARTCMTAVQNDARIDGYMQARELGIDVKKGWLATLDNRTRQSHRHLDGEIVELEEYFSNGCMYPGDSHGDTSNSRYGPAEYYNCRCTLVPKIGNAKMLPMSMRANNLPEGISYEEWKGIKSESWKTRIQMIRDQIQGRPTTEQIRQAGGIFAKEINTGYKKEAEQISSIKQQIGEVGTESRSVGNELAKLRDEWFNDPNNAYKKLGFASDEDLQKKIMILDDKYVAIEERRAELRKQLSQLRKSRTQYAEELTKKLSEVREMGLTADMQKEIVKSHLNGRSPMKKVVVQAYDSYPTDWIKYSIEHGSLTPKKVDRGFYSHYRKEIAISGWSNESQFETAIHELGHRYERVVPGILDEEKAFYEKRTKGEDLEWLGRGYAKHEKTRKDDFIHPYMGKDYGGSAFELVSMGFEDAYTNPLELMKDPDMQEWILGMLAIL